MVDCIIGGSPCQDLSVAGKRAGLAGERSGLYMDQIRIIKEMRHKDEQRGRTGESIRPRYMVWENVPGAFSSNQGKDFAAVLEEATRIAEPEAPNVTVPEKGWPTAGCLMGNSWSVAWRVLDAQFWGVPQRRRRIALVADFGGQSAPEILFVRKGVSGNIEPGEPKRKEAPGDSGESTGGSGKAVGFPLGFRPENVRCYDEVATTLCNGTRPGFTTGVIQPKVYDARGNGDGQLVATITGDHEKRITDYSSVVIESAREAVLANGQSVVGTLMANAGTKLWLGNQDAFSGAYHIIEHLSNVRRIVRRLTPLECERLQGYPDGWTDIGEWIDSKGKKHKEADSPRYKALGNSIAIPPWKWVLKRLCACYERDATMASLFDGIGGFPYIWEQLNGKGSCLWASEIEEFPMAVTKLRFSE